MRLGDDDRGRVPFALVGVVLLVASATLATTVQVAGPAPVDRRTGAAVEEAKAAARTALHDAVARAGRRAAATPLTEPADTHWGRTINGSRPFRDWLRVHVYVAAVAEFHAIDAGAGGLAASVSLPDVTGPDSLRAAKRRVSLSPVENESGLLAVTVENVTVTVRRGGRVVARESFALSVTAATPALALHRRVSRFGRLADRGPLDGDGLGARLTARLYAAAWARGYAQYGGAPVLEVVANRHVELLANGVLLGLQRDALGRSDRRGRAALARQTARVARQDLVEPVRAVIDVPLDQNLHGSDAPDAAPGFAPDANRRSERVRVGVNQSADRALVGFVAGDGEPSLDAVLDDVYAARVRLASRVRRVGESVERDEQPPAGWTRTGATTVATATRVEPAAASPPASPAGFHRLAAFGRVVVRERRVRERWRRGDRTRVVSAVYRERYRVAIAVVGDHATSDHGPGQPVRTPHRPGGPLDGTNYAPVRAAAVERLVAGRGGRDALARRAVAGTLDGSPVRVDVPRPPGLREWVYGDLADLRDAVRNASVRVERRRFGSGANPARRLAARLRERRAALVDAPESYASVAERARVAARAAYLDRVLAELDARTDDTASVQERLAAALGRANVSRRLASFAAPEQGRRADSGVRVVAVEGSPPYLTRAAVEPERIAGVEDRYHPLVARNHNLFKVPYGAAADRVLDAAGVPSGRVRLVTAARALRSANRTLRDEANASLRDRRTRLQRAVRDALGHVRGRLDAALARSAPGLSPAERDAALDAAFARWPTTEARALAAANGSLAGAVARETRARWSSPGRVRRGLLAVRLRLALRRALRDPEAQPPQGVVKSTAAEVRSVAREVVASGIERGLRNASERVVRRYADRLRVVPAGVPVTPVPGYWYATVNAWTVEVRGWYARFTVRAAGGTPADAPNATVAYVREAGRATLDVDGDGDPEVFGRSTPVSFRVRTAVVVVVPPGGSGVGDRVGGAIQESPGWSAWNRTRAGDGSAST